MGDGVPAGTAAAAVWLEKACAHNDAVGCRVLGDLLRDGKGVTKDEARAAVLRKHACELGDTAACERSAPAAVVDAGP